MVKKGGLSATLLAKWEAASDQGVTGKINFHASERKVPRKDEALTYIYMYFVYQLYRGDEDNANRTPETEFIVNFSHVPTLRPVSLSKLPQAEGLPVPEVLALKDGTPPPRDWTPVKVEHINKSAHNYIDDESRKFGTLRQRISDAENSPIPRTMSSPLRGRTRVKQHHNAH